MTGRYAEYANVADFTVYKMQQLIHDMQKLQRADIVTVLEGALASYVSGLIDIHFVGGWPHISHDIKEYDMSD
jgi:NCAIR mutase (PurE)-related protein